ncbi:MAG: DNA/RNA non-specific endonuclease, partial [Alistipes sp.]
DSYGNTASPKRTSFGGVQASVPTMFYYVLLRTRSGNSGKSVTQCSASELKCVGFVMSHAMPKGHKPERRDMRSVAEIEKMAGFQFFTNVPNAPKDSYTASDWGF